MGLTEERQKLRDVEEKIKKCKAAKIKIENSNNSCSKQMNEWNMSFNKLNNNAELKKVKKKDVFEGEMADSMAKRVGEVTDDIGKAIKSGGNLSSALGSQITKLGNKITALESEKTRLQASIAALEEQEKQARLRQRGM